METNDRGFSLLKLLAETELHKRNRNSKLSSKKISPDDVSGIADAIKDLIYDQKLTIDGHSYTINAVNSEKNAILLWLFSDSADEEKTIKITLKVDALDVDKSYWADDNE